MKEETIEFLLNNEPWTEYRTRIDLLGESEKSENVISAKERMLKHSNVVSLFKELNEWPGSVVSSHKSAGQLYHKLVFAAELGLTKENPQIEKVIKKIFKQFSDEGPFQVLMNIPVHFGGSGKDEFAWALCDAPLLVYAIARFGLKSEKQVIKAKNYLIQLCRENGFPCAVSKNLGKFRGPGKKDDPCPYATLIMLKLMSQFEKDKNSDCAKKCIDCLLNLWEKSKTLHPYLFYMGTDFRKLKAPLIWYDIIHLADTLSNFDYAKKDKRYKEIIKIIESKADANGLFTPESEWKAWKDWDFGQKKKPSSWLSYLVWRIKYRNSE